MPLYMLHRSMLLAKLLALDLPLEHEGRIHKAIDHEGLPMALYLPLSAGAYFDKLQDQRLDQLELQKAMAMELKWILSKVLDQPAILPMPRAPIDSLENSQTNRIVSKKKGGGLPRSGDGGIARSENLTFEQLLNKRPRMAYGACYLKGTRFFDRGGMIAGASPRSARWPIGIAAFGPLYNKKFRLGPGKRWQQQKGRGPCNCCARPSS
ncbi:hypothetical protein V6N12_068110 [Hibiscus sabdariffa]|uniref:Uncharacterized protein n=1 Tax=Hibiscus sabdariffa TaxID=183260 RepID=A0ABR2FP50_9ROSI